MAITQDAPTLVDEIADFLASAPSREQLLSYHPPERVQQRARELLERVREGHLSAEERQELDLFEHAEMLMQLVKAKARLKATQLGRAGRP